MGKQYRMKMETGLIRTRGGAKPSFTVMVNVKQPLRKFDLALPFFGRGFAVRTVECRERGKEDIVFARRIVFLLGRTRFRVKEGLLSVGSSYELRIT